MFFKVFKVFQGFHALHINSKRTVDKRISYISVLTQVWEESVFGYGWPRKLLVFRLFHCTEEIAVMQVQPERNSWPAEAEFMLSVCQHCGHTTKLRKKILKGTERDRPGWKRGKRRFTSLFT